MTMKKKQIEYSSIKWEKKKDVCIKNCYMKEKQDKSKKIIEDFKLLNQKDYVGFYYTLSLYYHQLADFSYLLENDIEACKGYCYLVAKSIDTAYKLFNNGMEPAAWLRKEISARKSEEFAAYCAIVVDNYDLAKSILSENTIIGNLLLGNIEKAKQGINDMPEKDGIKDIFLAIVNNEPKNLEQGIVKRLKTLRKQSIDYLTIVDIWSIALIKIAKKLGVNIEEIDIEVIEMPKQLLDEIKIDYERWKLPAV
ncbi:hypothetical protein [Clostridium sp. C2-6-12]|uniref:hypothetical protein n=1 Tax=Clostridium sp. C2-6-12 TaxID=2698832 RepID=UPI00136DE7A2|nr:hypothetical protein [Clostridium sp. C2-6-12]